MSKLHDKLEKLGVLTAKRHIFICIGPDCCRTREGEHTWDYIKHRMKQLDLDVMRTKAGCFRVCKDGPLMVVYPEGTWYGRVNPERFEQILQEHVIGGRPVKELAIAENPLCQPSVAPPLEA